MKKKKPYNPIPKTVKAEILHAPNNSPAHEWKLSITTNKGDILFFDVEAIKRAHYMGLIGDSFNNNFAPFGKTRDNEIW